jgi:cytochrome oxidase Cu insertion factor (SCO1/SenC/PrrC family)
MRRGALAALVLGAALVASAGTHEEHPGAGPEAVEPVVPSPGFELPAAGSYALPTIQRVADAELLGADGKAARLLDLAPGELGVVSFVYTHCPDACPGVLATLQRVDRLLAQRPALGERVRLVSVSFDPERDTPARMAELRDHLRPQGEWRFLTAASAAQVAPVLADFSQDVLPLVRDDGSQTGLLQHVMKVFLVDAEHRVRNVYGAGFLSPEILLLDLETLALEGGA